MFTRKSLPCITTLSQMCNAFGISISEFFKENLDDESTYQDLVLLSNYKKLGKRDKKIVNSLITCLLEKHFE